MPPGNKELKSENYHAQPFYQPLKPSPDSTQADSNRFHYLRLCKSIRSKLKNLNSCLKRSDCHFEKTEIERKKQRKTAENEQKMQTAEKMQN